MDLTEITATDLPDAWFQTVYSILQKGREFVIDHGSYAGQKRLEFDYVTIKVQYPCSGQPHERLPKLRYDLGIPDPVNPDYVFGGPTHVDSDGNPSRNYVEYLMTDTIEENELYTYGSRLVSYPIVGIGLINSIDNEIWNNPKLVNKEKITLDQVEYAIWRYKKEGYRNNQIVLQIAHPNDLLVKDSPCLRHVDTRIQDGRLHFVIYFRSWDLWGGFPANLAAISVLMDYMANEIGVETGEFICSSKGLHLYDYTWELAEKVRGRTMEEFRGELL